MGQLANYIRQGLVPCDVAFVQVAPAVNGSHSYGLASDFTADIVTKARVVIAEVNDQVPETQCERRLAAADIDYIVESSRPPAALAPVSIGDMDRVIARNAAAYIGDGAVLQVGIGAVPEAVMQLLTDRRDLGVHSGMIGDGLMTLAEKGVITNARKPFDQGVSVTSLLIGSARLFAHAHRNPALSMRTSAYTQSPDVLCRLPNMVGLNTALEVDLTGQMNAEQVGDAYIGGVGGSAEYMRAVQRSPGGRAIMAMTSMVKGKSRIQARLEAAVVTTPRCDADIIVTEYGAAELRAQTIPERIRRMIAIAHPDMRESLEREAHPMLKRGF
jgi:acyl-CoA hydrolase